MFLLVFTAMNQCNDTTYVFIENVTIVIEHYYNCIINNLLISFTMSKQN